MLEKGKIKLFHRVSVKSKFLMMILGIAVTCIAVIGFQGLQYGKKSLTKSMYDHLTSLQSARTQQIENYFENKRNLMKTFASQKSVVDAMSEFSAGFNLLDTYNVAIDQNKSLELQNFYKNNFVERLNQNSLEEYSFTTLTPKLDVVKYLQYHYIVNNPSKISKKELMESAEDNSYYSEVHQKFHSTLRDIVRNQGFRDLFLIDAKSLHVIYSVAKGVDFSTNLNHGPYAQSSLAKVVRKIVSNPNKGKVKVSDFKNYKPSHNLPQAFFAVPIYDNSELIGILAAQISVDSINNITTGDKNWKHDGLGHSGEVYLVGRDFEMRSNARKLMENPNAFFADLNKTDLKEEEKRVIISMKSTILNQSVHSEAIKRAVEGQEGTVITKNYLGEKVLSAYAPLQLEGLDWVIIAEKELSEAEEPIRSFQNSLLISATILATLITFYAIWLAYTFLAPINSMANGVKNIINKTSTSTINLQRDDEFGELSKNIDKMIETINEQKEQLDVKTKENDELLLNILPQSIATRVKNGEENIAESIPNVAVLFSVLHGFDHLSNTLEAKESIELLNQLINEFDNQAQIFGIEKITTIGDSYMAASGLITPRLDYARRMSEYALKMFEVVDRFNQRHQTSLALSIGVDAGEVMAGIVGKHKFVYDIWGEIVNDANRISHEINSSTLCVTEAVYSQLTNQEMFTLSSESEEPLYKLNINKQKS
jgi:class 3 adenylate cyclase/HAMP domain-containing protein